MFVGPWSKFTECDKAKDFLTKQGVSFTSLPGAEGQSVVTKVGDVELKGWDDREAAWRVINEARDAYRRALEFPRF